MSDLKLTTPRGVVSWEASLNAYSGPEVNQVERLLTVRGRGEYELVGLRPIAIQGFLIWQKQVQMRTSSRKSS